MRHVTALLLLALPACVPAPEGEDQCPDLNDEETAKKAAESSPTTQPDIDAHMEAYLSSRPNVPGCTVAFVQDLGVWYTQGYGRADLEKGRPMAASTPLAVGSMSKTITAAAAMRLVDEGLLDLDYPASFYVVLPTAMQTFTIRDLLSHQSGLPHFPTFDKDWDTLTELADHWPKVENPVLWPELVIHGWTSATPMSVKPGQSAVYSSAGIDDPELAPYTPCLREQWRDKSEDIPNLAVGYTQDKNGNQGPSDWVAPLEAKNLVPGYSGPSGGWTMDAADFARFLIGLDAGTILSQASVDEMMSREVQVNISGAQVWYGLGVGLDDQLGRTTRAPHGGPPGSRRPARGGRRRRVRARRRRPPAARRAVGARSRGPPLAWSEGCESGAAGRALARSRAHAERAPAAACKVASRWSDPLDSRLHCGEGPAVAW